MALSEEEAAKLTVMMTASDPSVYGEFQGTEYVVFTKVPWYKLNDTNVWVLQLHNSKVLYIRPEHWQAFYDAVSTNNLFASYMAELHHAMPLQRRIDQWQKPSEPAEMPPDNWTVGWTTLDRDEIKDRPLVLLRDDADAEDQPFLVKWPLLYGLYHHPHREQDFNTFFYFFWPFVRDADKIITAYNRHFPVHTFESYATQQVSSPHEFLPDVLAAVLHDETPLRFRDGCLEKSHMVGKSYFYGIVPKYDSSINTNYYGDLRKAWNVVVTNFYNNETLYEDLVARNTMYRLTLDASVKVLQELLQDDTSDIGIMDNDEYNDACLFVFNVDDRVYHYWGTMFQLLAYALNANLQNKRPAERRVGVLPPLRWHVKDTGDVRTDTDSIVAYKMANDTTLRLGGISSLGCTRWLAQPNVHVVVELRDLHDLLWKFVEDEVKTNTTLQSARGDADYIPVYRTVDVASGEELSDYDKTNYGVGSALYYRKHYLDSGPDDMVNIVFENGGTLPFATKYCELNGKPLSHYFVVHSNNRLYFYDDALQVRSYAIDAERFAYVDGRLNLTIQEQPQLHERVHELSTFDNWSRVSTDTDGLYPAVVNWNGKLNTKIPENTVRVLSGNGKHVVIFQQRQPYAIRKEKDAVAVVPMSTDYRVQVYMLTEIFGKPDFRRVTDDGVDDNRLEAFNYVISDYTRTSEAELRARGGGVVEDGQDYYKTVEGVLTRQLLTSPESANHPIVIDGSDSKGNWNCCGTFTYVRNVRHDDDTQGVTCWYCYKSRV